MNTRRVALVWRKDMRDAIRDGRILIALLLPVFMGVYFAVIGGQGERQPEVTLAVSTASPAVPDAIGRQLGNSVEFTVARMSAEEVRVAVRDDNADLGLVVPDGFDAAIKAGANASPAQQPALELVRSAQSSAGADLLADALDGALRDLAGQKTPAQVGVEVIPAANTGDLAVLPTLGLRTWLVTLTLVLAACMIGVLAVPMLLTEELEKRTIEALALVATDTEIMVGKIAVGVTYLAIAAGAMLILTGESVDNVVVVVVTLLLLMVSLASMGLLLGALLKTTNRVNNLAGFLAVGLSLPAFVVGTPLATGGARWILDVLPMSQAARLLLDAVSGQDFFSAGGASDLLSFGVLAAWTVVAMLLLRRSLVRAQLR
ncbi:MAG: ABC transporter permease [Actinomycetota bacterium]